MQRRLYVAILIIVVVLVLVIVAVTEVQSPSGETPQAATETIDPGVTPTSP